MHLTNGSIHQPFQHPRGKLGQDAPVTVTPLVTPSSSLL